MTPEKIEHPGTVVDSWADADKVGDMAVVDWERDPEGESGLLLFTLQEKANRLHVSTEELDELGVFKRPSIREEWDSIAEQLQEEQARSILEDRKDRIREAIRFEIIQAWLNRNLKDLGGEKRIELFHLIESGSRAEQTRALQLYLEDVLSLGIEEAEKRRKRRNRGGWIQLTWAVAKGLVKITAVLLILLAANSQFQQMVLAILVLMYSTMSFYVESHGVERAHDGTILTDLLNRIRILLRDPILKDGWEPSGDWLESISRSSTALAISTFVNAVIELMAIVALVLAILES